MKSLVNRDEIRRLEKAAREKDKRKLYEWAQQYEVSISSYLQRLYEVKYQNELANAYDVLILSTMYSLLTATELNLKDENIELFLDRFHEIMDGFRTGKFVIKDFEKELVKLGLKLEEYNYQHRITDIGVFVLSDEFKDKRDKILEHLNALEMIVMELDNKQENEKQLRKNIDMINMCTRLYFYGDSDIIDKYKQYAIQIKKPVVEAIFVNSEGENEDNEFKDNIKEGD